MSKEIIRCMPLYFVTGSTLSSPSAMQHIVVFLVFTFKQNTIIYYDSTTQKCPQQNNFLICNIKGVSHAQKSTENSLSMEIYFSSQFY